MIPVDWLLIVSVIISIVSITAAVLNAKLIVYCFPIWIAANVAWIAYSVVLQLYGSILMWVCYTVICIDGWRTWNKKKVVK